MSELEKTGEISSEKIQIDERLVEDIVNQDPNDECSENPFKVVVEESKSEENIIEESSDKKIKSNEKESENDLNGERNAKNEEYTIKEYQGILQELKEEIARLNKQVDQKSKDKSSEPSEEEIFKLKCMCKYTKQEIDELTTKLLELNKVAEQTEKTLENLKENSFDQDTSNETIDNLSKKVKELEEEYDELCKSNNEISFADLDKILSTEVGKKFENEFFVKVQKRLSYLETENTALTSSLKKYNLETIKLKEKCDKASSRNKSNDELRNKLKEIEETYATYVEIEERLGLDLKKAEEEYNIQYSCPEYKHDASSAQKMLDEINEGSKKDKDEIERLEYKLQEKKNLLRAARAYGLQRSKTSNKLRSDMELLGLVLIEKDQAIGKLKKEIDEIKWKQVQAEVEIKELNDKKIQI